MPIYAYKCSACGFAKDVLQKMSDTPLSVCSSCGAETFTKQLTAAGFQLKGSGWYVTDFRDGGGKKGADKSDKDGGAAAESSAEQGADNAGKASSDAAPAAKPADSTSAPVKATPAASASTSTPPAPAAAAKSD